MIFKASPIPHTIKNSSSSSCTVNYLLTFLHYLLERKACWSSFAIISRACLRPHPALYSSPYLIASIGSHNQDAIHQKELFGSIA